jgi:hypothetical protein
MKDALGNSPSWTILATYAHVIKKATAASEGALDFNSNDRNSNPQSGVLANPAQYRKPLFHRPFEATRFPTATNVNYPFPGAPLESCYYGPYSRSATSFQALPRFLNSKL